MFEDSTAHKKKSQEKSKVLPLFDLFSFYFVDFNVRDDYDSPFESMHSMVSSGVSVVGVDCFAKKAQTIRPADDILTLHKY